MLSAFKTTEWLKKESPSLVATDEEMRNYLGSFFETNGFDVLYEVDELRNATIKNPFFKLYGSFQFSCTWKKFFKTEKPSLNDIMLLGLTKVFPNKNFEASERYDYVDVQHRLVEKLKELDQVIPGTYHKDAEITDLKFSTKDFISFPKCKQMLTSFIDIVDSAKELFFKALDIELSEEEINELNFLANWLYMSDSVMPSVYLTYDNVRLYRNVYKHEGYKSFLSYAKIRRFVNEEPWRCKEFFDDMSVVQDFINIFPRAKSAMNEFATNVTKFSCEFTWSDAKPIVLSDEEELEFRHSEEYIPVEERRKESTHKYEFFFDFDEETKERIDMPLFPEADIDDHTLERISTYIGLTKQEILNMDELAAKRYYDKYYSKNISNIQPKLDEWKMLLNEIDSNKP